MIRRAGMRWKASRRAGAERRRAGRLRAGRVLRVVAVVTAAGGWGCDARLAGPPRIAPIEVNLTADSAPASGLAKGARGQSRYITWSPDERPPATDAIVADALQPRADPP